MLQILIVALIVVAAAIYLLWRYMPQRWRHPLARIDPRLAEAQSCGGGCSSCDSGSGAQTSCHTGPLDATDSKPIELHGKLGQRGL